MWVVPSEILYRLTFIENRRGKRVNPDRANARIELQALLGHPEAFWQPKFQEGSRYAVPVSLQVIGK